LDVLVILLRLRHLAVNTSAFRDLSFLFGLFAGMASLLWSWRQPPHGGHASGKTALILLVDGLLMLTNKWARQRRRQNMLTDLTIVPALAFGAAQMWARIPGLSRSGSTISAGRLLDSDFEHAAHGFLLATPIFAGALGELLRLHLRLTGLLVPSLIGGIVAGLAA